MTEDLAVFIDWENIYISTVSEYNSKPNVSAILEKAREYGRIVSATAYADWTDGEFRDAPPTLYSNGISPRYISARYFPGGRSQKRRTNSIDVMLAVECSDFLHNHPQVDTYVLVTGRSEEHTSELQSPCNLVCRLLLEKKKKQTHTFNCGT